MDAFYSQNGSTDSQGLTGYSRIPRIGCSFHYKDFERPHNTLKLTKPGVYCKRIFATSKVSPPAHVPSPSLYSGSHPFGDSRDLKSGCIWLYLVSSGFIWFPITLPLMKSGAKSARHCKSQGGPVTCSTCKCVHLPPVVWHAARKANMTALFKGQVL